MPHLEHDMFRRLCRARELLRDRAEPLSVEQVAHEVAISPFHFIRRFQDVFGTTPNQFRTAERIERAKRLLARGASVTETCCAVGFTSLGSFSALFKQRVGVTPSVYQREVRVLVAVPEGYRRHFAPGCLSLLGLLPAAAFRSFREA
jgi:AraC-like DNA-binding protein